MSGSGSGSHMSTADLERILEVTRKLAAPFDLGTILSQVIDAGRAILRADRGTVFLFDAKTDELFITAATGIEMARFPADRGIAGECARTRSVVNVPDCYADPRFNPDIDKKTGYRTRCLLTVPLIGHDDSLVGVLQMLNKVDGVFTAEDEQVATALGAQCAVALQRVRLMAEVVAKEKMERELAVARDVQMRVLPKVMPPVAGYDLAGWSRPADETGGDVFDVIALDTRRTMLLLGDATGHGIGPALSVTQVRAMLRIAMRLGAELDATFAQINDQLCDDLADNRFVTAFLGLLDNETHRINYHSGGQGPLLHFHAASKEFEWLGSSTLPLGTIPGLKLKQPPPRALEPGDIFGLMTDGIYEMNDPADELFGKERVAELILAHQNETMARLIEIIVQEAERFASGAPQGDDVTLLLVRRLP
jgi:sigma-B regulation protein RsbU (phosphoserine phosphatase)